MPFHTTLFCSHRQLGFGQLGIIIHSAVYGALGFVLLYRQLTRECLVYVRPFKMEHDQA